MRVVLTGQRTFGAAALRALEDERKACVVAVCAPGAGEDRLRHEAQRRGLPWVASETLRADQLPLCDLIVAAHSHAYLSRKARSRAAHGAIGYHPSLLPRHRGRDAVRWTVAMGDPIAGGSVYYMTDNVDAGPVLRSHWLHVGKDWDYHRLWREMFEPGIQCLTEAVAQIAADRGILEMTPQQEEFATWEPSWERPPLFRPELPELSSSSTR